MNPYSDHIRNLFANFLELRHLAFHLQTVLKSSIQDYEKINSEYIVSSGMVISDWTEDDKSKWVNNYHTGTTRLTRKDEYEGEINALYSNYLCNSFAQSFERLETFLKDCIFTKAQRDKEFLSFLEKQLKKEISRENLTGGDPLFKQVKVACGESFQDYSINNNRNIKFKEFWTIISESRHAITHSSSRIEVEKINKSEYHFHLFDCLFEYDKISDNELKIRMQYNGFNRLQKYTVEFAFQVFKLLSISEDLDWNILEGNTAHNST